MKIVLLLSALSSVVAIEICGNYCGPSWCSGEKSPECAQVDGSGCVQSSSNCAEAGPTDGSCADACCKTHDACCGSTDRTGCNNAIIACLKECEGSEGTACKRDGVPVPAGVVRDGMELDPFGCCGTSCGKEETSVEA